MGYASLEEAWGETFTNYNSKKKTKSKGKKTRKNIERFKSNYDNNIIEQFENFNQNVNMNSNVAGNTYKPDIVHEISPNEEDDEGEYAPIYPEKNIRGIDSNSLKRLNENNKEKDIDEDLVSTSSDDIIELKPNKNCDIKTEMKEMNDKINFILNKINSREDFNTINGSKDNVNKNLYDIILFILFGLFIILIFESINKLALRGSENFVCVPKIKLPEVTQ